MSGTGDEADLGDQRQVGQHRVTVALILDFQRRMEVEVHIQHLRNAVRLVDSAASRPMHVQFLQAHDIGLATRDYAGDASRKALPQPLAVEQKCGSAAPPV